MVRDYMGHHQTIMPVPKINFKAHTLMMLRQIINQSGACPGQCW